MSDWQGKFGVGGWYDPINNVVYLNPRSGYEVGKPLTNFGLSLVVHEAMHIEQGTWRANSAYGELQAWQAGFRTLQALQNGVLSPTQQAIVDLPLNHNYWNLRTAVILMEQDQNWQYWGGYILPLW